MKTSWATALAGLLVLGTASCTAQSAAPHAPAPQQPCDQGGFAAIVQEVAPSVFTLRHSEGIGSGVVTLCATPRRGSTLTTSRCAGCPNEEDWLA
jgi:hypothetical protein